MLAVRSERLIVVHVTFPYKEQMDLYRKALRVEKNEGGYCKAPRPGASRTGSEHAADSHDASTISGRLTARP